MKTNDSLQEIQPVIVPTPEDARTPLAPGPAAQKGPGVYVAPNHHDLVMIATDSAPMVATQEQKDLNAIVHRVLLIGLGASAALMLIGIALDLIYRRALPTSVPMLGEVLTRVEALRPSGFLSLGLLVLIATPIIRVIGSIGAFVYERDWRFAGVTSLVLIVLVVSIIVGRG